MLRWKLVKVQEPPFFHYNSMFKTIKESDRKNSERVKKQNERVEKSGLGEGK